MSEKAKEQYELLLDILGLCEIYYDEQEFEDRKEEYTAYWNVGQGNIMAKKTLTEKEKQYRAWVRKNRKKK